MRNFNYFLNRNRQIIFWITFLFFYAASITYAVPPSTQYNPGETLDPGCVPGSSHCTVAINTIYSADGTLGGDREVMLGGHTLGFTGGNVGIGTNTPASLLDVTIGTTIHYQQSFTGSGLNDATFSGTYAGADVPNIVHVAIDESFADTIDYWDENGDCPIVYEVPITGSPQLICDGISITFASPTGHNPFDQWDYDITSSVSDSNPVFNIHDQNGSYFSVNAVTQDSVFIGDGAGIGATTAFHSFFLGSDAGSGSTSASGSAFIGQLAGASAPSAANSNFFGYTAGNQATNATDSNFFGQSAGNAATNAYESNFFGNSAGASATSASYSNFFGYTAGLGATNATESNFFGDTAGYQATHAVFSNFFGTGAGQNATNASNSNFFGNGAGYFSSGASHSNFFGQEAGEAATNATYANFFGACAGCNAANASNSNFLGQNAGFGAANASNSIFIGQSAGNSDTVNNTGSADDFSILIGKSTSTGGFKNSIALGGSAANTASNQFMIGSTTRPIDSTRINGSASTQCTITTGTGIACTSDQRLKTDIVDLGSDTLDKLAGVRTVTFNWLADPDGPTQVGFLAQNLEGIFPELVSTDSDGYKSVYYAQMAPILTEAVKELDLKIEDINNLDNTDDSSFGGKLRAWLANAANHVTRIFTGEICLTDSDGSSECLNKTELGQLKALIEDHSHQQDGQTPPATPPSDTPPADSGDQSDTPPDSSANSGPDASPPADDAGNPAPGDSDTPPSGDSAGDPAPDSGQSGAPDAPPAPDDSSSPASSN